MCIAVKAYVQGSVEALSRALRDLKQKNNEATVAIKV
jgi:translation initiation factor IF-2